MLTCEQMKRVLSFTGNHEMLDQISILDDAKKDEDYELKFIVNCNDIFAWGVADGEYIRNEEDIELLEKTLEDCYQVAGEVKAEEYTPILYCARKRKMRPQDAVYHKIIPEELWSLFNKCGPERELGPGNPG